MSSNSTAHMLHFRTGKNNPVWLRVYADASGSDDWTHSSDPWYIISLALVRRSHRLKCYREWAATIPGGIHLSARRGRDGMRSHDICKTAIAFDACEYSITFLVYKPEFIIAHRHKSSSWLSEALWSMVLDALIAQMHHCNEEVRTMVKSITVNHPGRGTDGLRHIKAGIERMSNVPIDSVDGKDPCIGLADALAWATRRWITRGEKAQFPWEPSDVVPRHYFAGVGSEGRLESCGSLLHLKNWAASIELTARKTSHG